MLRSSAGTAVDVDGHFLSRKAVLEAKRKGKGAASAGGVGQSELTRRLFKSWDKAPQAAREAYRAYVAAVGALVGEGSSEEINEVAAAAFDVLCAVNKPPQARTIKDPHMEAVAAVLGYAVEKAAMLKAAEAASKLAKWQEGSLLAASSSSSSSGSSALASAALGGGVEFGMDIDFTPPRPVAYEEEEEEADAGRRGGGGGGDGGGGGRSSSGATSAAAPAPSALRKMFSEGVELQTEPLEEGEEVDLRWLSRQCENAAAIGMGAGSGEELSLGVCRILMAARSSDEAGAELFDLLGDLALDFIGKLCENRAKLAAQLETRLSQAREAAGGGGTGMGGNKPAYGQQVTVTSASGKALEKLRRKEGRRDARRAAAMGGGGDTAIEVMSSLGFGALLEQEALERREEREQAEAGRAGGRELGVGAGTQMGMWGKGMLPKGTSRTHVKDPKTGGGYEEVKVPAATPAARPEGERIVKIEELDEWAQLAFEGFKTLNRIQSKIFETAYRSNENLLVCAPTGAGKTNIAMITVLHEVAQNLVSGVLQKGDFKVVYVAPMKALAAEMTAAFARRLRPLGIAVRELTGDMQLTKKEMMETQMIVTTPEKWDVITRKGGDVAVASAVRLLIIDEVHLLNDDRGPVIETLIARTLRQVETSQSMIRIVGLSATLPNHVDVALFLGVSLETGLFYFDASYRPVPLTQTFIGVTDTKIVERNNRMAEITFNKVVDAIKRGKQAMVFVHSRKDTAKTAKQLMEMAQQRNMSELFDGKEHPRFALMQKDVMRSRNRELTELVQGGFAIHHAGMLRADRTLSEKLFSEGVVKVLCCTATLAWGVNLPAHTVIIKGTQLYNPEKGTFVELGMLDVMQIFGRAGRPQFDTSGDAYIITTHSKLSHYLSLLTHSLPIESQFVRRLKDNLNAEVVLGTVTNVREACTWLSYTYLFVRMMRNPLVYGVSWEEVEMDPRLDAKRRTLITDAARALDRSRMVRFDEKSGNIYVTELGRVASHYYITQQSIDTCAEMLKQGLGYNEMLKQHMSEADVLAMISHSAEFENIVVRDDEVPELEFLKRKACPVDVKGGVENKHGKINILLQAFLSRAQLQAFSLIADTNYVSSNVGRICRALFEICLRKGWSMMADTMLAYCKAADRRIWPHAHPLRQLETILKPDLIYRLEERGAFMEQLYDMEAKDIGAMLRLPLAGQTIRGAIDSFPAVSLEAAVQPITRGVLRVQLTITPEFRWKDNIHGNVQRWWIWVEDSENDRIYHNEMWLLTKKMMREPSHKLAFTIPVTEPLPAQYYIRAVSDDWLSAEAYHTLSFKDIILPERHPPNTELLPLQPLPVTALNNPVYESMYTRFKYFNPIQTQAFHTLYHTDTNVLLGAPTGSGKTISSELAMMRAFTRHPGQKVIYIAPLKALVKERIKDWGQGLCKKLRKKMVELTGDHTPDLRALMAADIIICTPEKWDGISRSWQNRSYVKKVCLVVIDEIHLLGADRGPILEVIVSRMRYIASQTDNPVRVVGLSTALANARDLADWLGIEEVGLFNFKPSVRPIPMDAHIQGFSGKFYCPRMASMNKPAYAAITTHSPIKPVLVFVSSRRQTRLTALDLIAYAAADEKPRQFLHADEAELEYLLEGVRSAELKHTLQFGIGLHHAGLAESDRNLVEELFVGCKIQILVCTSTLAWGVNFPAHLVVIKGTEFFDGKLKRYVDYPITDVLQMMGRAGRPQFDTKGVAVIMVHEPKKSFYKKFLYEPFPVESSLPEQLHDHFNAEVVAGTIRSRQDAVDYLTWTYFFRRLVLNPSYYQLEGVEAEDVNSFLSTLVEDTLEDLEGARCIELSEEGEVEPAMLGRVTSFYYLQYTTAALFATNVGADMDLEAVLMVLCATSEYDELPVRHNEDKVNVQMASGPGIRFPVDTRTADDPHTKANLLLQAHFSRLPLPMTDYLTDTKSVLDQSIRIMQALIDVAADGGWLTTTLSVMGLMQQVMQACWLEDPSVMLMPHITEDAAAKLAKKGIRVLPELLHQLIDNPGKAKQALTSAGLSPREADASLQVAARLPLLQVQWRPPAEEALHEAAAKGEDATLEVTVARSNARRGGGDAARVYAPRFPKVKEEGWWLVLGDLKSRELFALKRMSFQNKTTCKLRFPAASSRIGAAGAALPAVSLFVISDSYVGLDQQYTIPLYEEAPRPAAPRPAQEARGGGGGGGGEGGVPVPLAPGEVGEQRERRPRRGGAAAAGGGGGGAAEEEEDIEDDGLEEPFWEGEVPI